MSNSDVDNQDILILKALMANARASLREIAGKTNMAVGTVQNRLAKLKQKKILLGFKPTIDYSQLGFGVDTVISLNIRRDKINEIMKLLDEDPHVMSVYETTGEVDIFVRCVFKNPEELHYFLMDKLTDDLIKKSVSHIVMMNRRKDVLLDQLQVK
jgi:DNA-binding Lrp family transcriptional regulator